MKKSVSAIIFAGGKSSRMGKDKALLPFGKYDTLAEFQHHRLGKVFQKVYISAKENKFDFDCVVIEDIYKENSPLVGIISVFEALDAEEIFVLSVDAPFVSEDTIEKLLEHDDSALDAVVAQSPDGVHPLCGRYGRSILPLAYAQLKKENHRLRDLLELANTLYVQFDEDKPFTNLNRPQEYQEALKIVRNL